jgi:hypothetical protein
MKTTQYVNQERAIARADAGGIRERWLWGLRLLRDPEAMTQSGKSLQHGVTDQLIAAATARGYKLSASEIRYRLQCARTYPTEAEIAKVLGDFETWSALIAANFPAYEAPPDEPPADHRTESERDHDRARALLDLIGEQGSFFPASRFEPTTTPLKDLVAYTEEMEDLSAHFVERVKARRAYLDSLVEAADNDLSMTWQEAQERLEALADDDAEDDAS